MSRNHPVITAAMLFTTVALALVPATRADDEDSSVKVLRLKAATDHVRQFEVRWSDGIRDVPIDIIDRPLLTFGDAARATDNGTLWAWGRQGRPVAFLELYQWQSNKSYWVHTVSLTSTDLVSLRFQSTSQWTPKTVAIDPKPVPAAKAPAEKEPLRLRQMKEIAARFAAHEFWNPNNSRFELRLLVQPIHRYSDPEAKVHDGTAFIFANGTNPEIVVLVESIGESLKTSQWHFSAARIGAAEMHLVLDKQDVWTVPRAKPNSTTPYSIFVTPVESADRNPLGKDGQ